MSVSLSARDSDLAKILADPVIFAQAVLGHKVWLRGAEILYALDKPHAMVGVRACHGSSKTFTAAQAAIWFLQRYSDSIVVTTAPKLQQVRDLLWGEIRKAIRGSALAMPQPNIMRLDLSERNFAVGVTAKEGVNIAGYHAAHMLIVLDEAVGIAPDIWESIEGIRAAGDVRFLALANPVVPEGEFYNICTARRLGWKLFKIDAFDTPNLIGLGPDEMAALPRDLDLEDPIFEPDDPGWGFLISRRWVYEAMLKYGVESPFWASRVRGEFPQQAEDALYPLAWIERCDKNSKVPQIYNDEHLIAGVDVAGPGEDETAVAIRGAVSGHLYKLAAWNIPDSRGEVAATLKALGPPARYDAVRVDQNGIGFHFLTHLRDLGYKVTGVNAGSASTRADDYRNLKAELYWSFRAVLESEIPTGLKDEMAKSQLATIKYEHDSKGRIVIESKDDAKKRGLASPDRAEAIIMAYAERIGPRPLVHGRLGA